LKIEVLGLMRGFESLFNPRVPHVHLNPLFSPIPELDPSKGGSIIGSSRTYVDSRDSSALEPISERIRKLKIDGLICVGGDGTLNGMLPLCDLIPTVLAPKTIDNDLGLNYPNEPDKWIRDEDPSCQKGYKYRVWDSGFLSTPSQIQLEQMVNYVTPGYATAVFVAVEGITRIRTTAESHRRVAIVELMGRDSGYIALGTAYGQADIILVPESPIDVPRLVQRFKEIYELQRHVVIACGEGIVDQSGCILGDTQRSSTDPAGNIRLSGAAEKLRQILLDEVGEDFFRRHLGLADPRSSVFTRKVGHTQRGGRPLLFDRFNAAQLGGKTVDMLLEGQNNSVAILQWNREQGFYLSSCSANAFRDKYGRIHARTMHPSFYSSESMNISPIGVQYLLPIFKNAIGYDDVEYVRETRFDSGNLYARYHSVNADIEKRICYLD
jgi:6-phosphofructokinase 1